MFIELIQLLVLSDCLLTEAVDCNLFFSGRFQKGIIRSYNYPFNYENNLNCTYSVHFPDSNFTANKKICLNTRSFSLENSSPFCSFDYVKIGTPENNYKYCGDGIWQYGLFDFRNEYSSIWSKNLCWSIENKRIFEITFISDNATVEQGFYIEYLILDDKVSFPRNISNEAPCGFEQWVCFNRQCISSNKVCNGERDCGDGSDESYIHARCLQDKDLFACVISSDMVYTDNYCGLKFRGFKVDNRTQNGNERLTGLKTALTSSSIIGSSIHLDKKQYCFSIWYTFNGFGNATIFIFFNQNIKAPEWSKHFARKSQIDFSDWENIQLNIENLDEIIIQIDFKTEENCWFWTKAISLSEGLCSEGELSCNFATSLCGWSNANLPNLISLPNITSSSWNYMQEPETNQGFAHLNLQAEQAMGILMSPIHQPSEEFNDISVKYYIRSMKEADSCYISILIIALNGSLYEIWKGEGQQMNEWQVALTKYRLAKAHQILITGFGKSCFVFLKVIAINEGPDVNFPIDIPTASSPGMKDINISSTPNTFGTSVSDCGQSQSCKTLLCMSENLRCNGIIDCIDGIDELHCNVRAKLLGAGEIAGIVLGCILVLVLLAAVVLVRARAKKSDSSDARRSESTISILGQPFKFSSTKPPLPSITDLQQINSNITLTIDARNGNSFSNAKSGTDTNLSIVGSEGDVLEFPHALSQLRTTNHLLSDVRTDHIYEEPHYMSAYAGEGEASASSSFSYIQKHDTNIKDDTISLELRGPMGMKVDFSTPLQWSPQKLTQPDQLNFKNDSICDNTLSQSINRGNVMPIRKVSIDPRLYILGNNHKQREKMKNIFPVHATDV